MEYWIIVLIFWIICGIITYGLCFGAFQREFPSIAKKYYKSDIILAIVYGVLGPIGLFSVIAVSGVKHGFKWR